MAITPAALRAEITADPQGLGYANVPGGLHNHTALAALLNLQQFQRQGAMTIGQFSVWLTENYMRPKLKAGAANSALSAQIQDICNSVLALETNPHTQTIDTSDAKTVGMMQLLQTNGVVGPADTALFMQAGLVACSRAEQLDQPGTTVSYAQVAVALEGA